MPRRPRLDRRRAARSSPGEASGRTCARDGGRLGVLRRGCSRAVRRWWGPTGCTCCAARRRCRARSCARAMRRAVARARRDRLRIRARAGGAARGVLAAGAARLRLVLNGIGCPSRSRPRSGSQARRELGLSRAGVRGALRRPAGGAQAASRWRQRRCARSATALCCSWPATARCGRRSSGSAAPRCGCSASAPTCDRLLAAADAFVMPSEREGLSLAVLEAMGRGLPVVVSDGAGNPEAVGDAGIVVPLGDVSALAAALAPAGRRPASCARAGRGGPRAGARALHARALAGRDAGRVRPRARTSSARAPGRAAGARPA